MSMSLSHPGSWRVVGMLLTVKLFLARKNDDLAYTKTY